MKSNRTIILLGVLLLVAAASFTAPSQTQSPLPTSNVLSATATSNQLATLNSVGHEVSAYLALHTNILSNLAQCDAATWAHDKVWLEGEYAKLGYHLDLYYRSEFEIFLVGLRWATLSDEEFAKLQAARVQSIAIANLPPETVAKLGPNRILSREDFLANWVTNQFNLAPTPFNRTAWEDMESTKDWKRYRMFKSILASEKLENMPLEKLESLLGKPSAEGPGTVRYYMGRQLGLMDLDNSALVFQITNGKVNNWKFVPD